MATLEDDYRTEKYVTPPKARNGDKWVRVDTMKPGRGALVICYCPDWCSTAYQVAKFSGKEFSYEDQPNDMFDQHVVAWSYFDEY